MPSTHSAAKALTRVPALRPEKVGWMPAATTFKLSSDAFSGVLCVELCGVTDRVDNLTWPVGVRTIDLGNCFSGSHERVAWPSSVRELKFGDRFDWPISGARGAVWPASLHQLTFGRHFDQPIAGAAWPSSLQRLTFGKNFDQPMAALQRLASLLRLTFWDGL